MGKRSLICAALACGVATLTSGMADATLLAPADLSPADPSGWRHAIEDWQQLNVVSIGTLSDTAASEWRALPIQGVFWPDALGPSGTAGGALPQREPVAAPRAIHGGGFPYVSGSFSNAVDVPAPVPLPASSWLLASGVLAVTIALSRSTRRQGRGCRSEPLAER